MGNSILKHRSWQRILTFLLAFAMLAAYIPAGAALADDEGEEAAPAGGNVHVLESNKLTEFAAGAKANGDETPAGDGDFFSIIWSSSSKVDTSSKKWDDGYSSDIRINLGGSISTSKNSIRFTTTSAATVKVWWAAGEDNRQIGIIANDTDDPVDVTKEDSVKNSPYLSTLTLDNAGTYYLGGVGGNNYIFKIEITENSASETYTLESNKLTEFAAGAKANGDETPAGDGDFYSIIWSSSSKVDTSSKTWEDGYSSGVRINLGGSVSTSKNSIRFTTTSAATVKVWWAAGEDNRQIGIIANDTDDPVDVTKEDSVKNSPYLSTLTLDNAGTYYLGGVGGNNYIFKIEITVGGGTVERDPWDGVAYPEITSAAQSGGNIKVTVKAGVGPNYADRITVTMTDKDGNTETKNSMDSSKTEHTFEFTPSASGKYNFSVVAARNGEDEEHKGAETKDVDFVLPLAAPNVKSATNKGGGSVTVEWDRVPEATGYIVTVDGEDISVETKDLYYNFAAGELEKGKTYTFKVQAVRNDEDPGPAGSIECTVVDKVEVTWAFSAFGASISKSKNDYEGNANDGSVRVWAGINGGTNGGKMVAAGADGVSFYYTKINPDTENFELTATAHVNAWSYSNGQEGFGLMASDIVGENGDGNDYFYNSYMALSSKFSYYWDGYEVTDDETAEKINMAQGIFAQAKLGVTKETLEDVIASKGYPIVTTATLETSCAQYGHDGTGWNIVGNFTPNETLAARTMNNLVDFTFTIGKNNTGYYISYTDPKGNVTTEQYYEPDVLSQQEEDAVYVGFFAARNVDVTFSNISFKTSNPKTDPPAQTRPVKQVTPNFSIASPVIANSPDYSVVYFGNADGNLMISDSDGKSIYNGHIDANKKLTIGRGQGSNNNDENNIYIEADVTLKEGVNTFRWSMTPDRDFRPNGSEYEVLSSYDTVSGTHTVTYGYHTRDIIYVSPNGKDTGEGSITDPMSIYEAVKWALPGQTIILMSGVYKLKSAITIERGISGTEDNYINLIGNPSSKDRPVLDFDTLYSGMTLAGDYWYLYGFDVTNSSDGNKGLQVSGNHNILERLLTYRNGNTGIQISRYKASDLTQNEWPSYNTILNCSSYLNSDSGYEDADGFAAKLTVGPGNVFDGCIAAYNADDGWDFFAKGETGPIGKVVIKNSVTFKNGYILDERGRVIDAGNGNGFKMGGSSITGYHELWNSVAFGNKAKGFDSNSCPDIQVYNSTSYNNESYNVAFYTSSSPNTDFGADGIISYKHGFPILDKTAEDYKKDEDPNVEEQLKPAGTQDTTKYEGVTNYYWDGTKSVNSAGDQVNENWFVSLDMNKAMSGTAEGITRNKDGSINMNGFLELTSEAPNDAGARLKGVKQEASPELPSGTTSSGGSNHGSSGAGGAGGAGGVGGGAGGGTTTPTTPATPSGGNTTTTTSPDGTRTETVTRADGSKTETVTRPDGSKTETVTKADGSKSETVKNASGDVTVIATAKNGEVVAKVELPATVPALGYKFEDVPSGHWAESAINTMAALNVVSGESSSGHVFNMNSNITRGAMAQILFNLSNGTEGKTENFGDVAEGAWYTNAVAWAANAGVVSGYADGTFGPNDSITREQLAVMLYRYADLLGVNTSASSTVLSGFADAGNVSSWSTSAMSWAVSKGLIQGKGASNLDPSASASRAETAVILQRFLGLMK